MVVVGVSVGGLWNTSITVDKSTTWWDVQKRIRAKTAIPECDQRLTPFGKGSAECGLGEGDELVCEVAEYTFPLKEAGV